MKNWGKFFMMVVLLSLVACGDKGGGSGGGGGGSPTNPYSWEELNRMLIPKTPTPIPASYSENIEELNLLLSQKGIRGVRVKEEQVKKIKNYMENRIFLPIMERDSSFNYSNTLLMFNNLNNETSEYLMDGFKKNYFFDLKLEIEKVEVAITDDYAKLQEIYRNLDASLRAIENRKEINHFYTEVPVLYNQYISNIESNSVFLKEKFNIDISKINIQNELIENALHILKSDKKIIKEDKHPDLKFIDTTLIRFIEDLEKAYIDYLSGKESLTYVGAMRERHRNLEGELLGTNTVVREWYLAIEDLDNKLKSLIINSENDIDGQKTRLKNDYISYIALYKQKNIEYGIENYNVIASKISNVLKTLTYFKYREHELKNVLGLEITF